MLQKFTFLKVDLGYSTFFSRRKNYLFIVLIAYI